MKVTYDLAKNSKNIDERNLSFDEVVDFNWETALVIEDTRYEYPEARYIATGLLRSRVHILCFTPIAGGIRVISFRKANNREVKRYEQTINR